MKENAFKTIASNVCSYRHKVEDLNIHEYLKSRYFNASQSTETGNPIQKHLDNSLN